MKTSAIILSGMIMVLTGCASPPVSNQAAKPVPAQRVINPSLTTRVNEDSGQVIIKRDAGFGGSACLTQIFMDGKILAEIDPSEKFTFYPSTGEHIFSARPKGMCGGGMVETEGVVKNDGVLPIVSGTGLTEILVSIGQHSERRRVRVI